MSDVAHQRSASRDKGLWNFALAVYAAPDVADACLALQDRYGCDVSLLLFAAWLSAIHHHRLLPSETSAAASAVREWHSEIVQPLRGVRRRLKSGPAPAPSASSEALRSRLKSVEIEAERLELDVLERLAQNWGATSGSLQEEATMANLSEVLRHLSGSEPAAEAMHLLAIVGKAASHTKPAVSA